MRHNSSFTVFIVLALFQACATSAAAQVGETGGSDPVAPDPGMSASAAPLQLASAPVDATQLSSGAPELDDPWSMRPVCASMFLKADWQLTSKQRACNWLQNGVLSTGRIFTTATSTVFSMVADRSSERGDGFQVRFGRKWVQGAVATTGEYIGSLIAHEDPREIPPYLVLRPAGPPRGFFARFGSAIASTVVTTQCVGRCTDPADIHKRFALSRVLGAVGSGAAGAALNSDEPNRSERALHGMLTAYVSAFGHQLLSEFKPEAAKLGGRVFRLLGGH
jgi:hypothetical protein